MLPTLPPSRTLPPRGIVPPALVPASKTATGIRARPLPAVATSFTAEPPALPPASGTMMGGHRVAPLIGAGDDSRPRSHSLPRTGASIVTVPAHVPAQALSHRLPPASGMGVPSVDAAPAHVTTAHNAPRHLSHPLPIATPGRVTVGPPMGMTAGSDPYPTVPGHLPRVSAPVLVGQERPTMPVHTGVTHAPPALNTRHIVHHHPTPPSNPSTRGFGSSWWTAIAWSIFIIGMATLALIFLL